MLQGQIHTLAYDYNCLGSGNPTVYQPALVHSLQNANMKAKVKINKYVCNAEFKETVTIFRGKETET